MFKTLRIDFTIKSIRDEGEYYSLEMLDVLSKNMVCCGLSKEYGIIPAIGNSVTLHLNGFLIRGMDIDNKKVYYDSEKETADNYSKIFHFILSALSVS